MANGQRQEFGERLKATLDAARAIDETQREEEATLRFEQQRQEAEERLRIARLFQRNKERQESLQGTPPEELFQQPEARTCREFIELMTELDMPGSVDLVTEKRQVGYYMYTTIFGRRKQGTRPMFETQTTRGYAIGLVSGFGNKTTGYNLFLCEDGDLRYRPVDGEIATPIPLLENGKYRNLSTGVMGTKRVEVIYPGNDSNYYPVQETRGWKDVPALIPVSVEALLMKIAAKNIPT